MKFSEADALSRKIDESLTITDLFNGQDFAFDFVLGELHGHHPMLINRTSDRAYYVIEGNGTIHVGDHSYTVKPGDLVTVKSNTSHGLDGDLKYAIITAPPFDPNNESLV